MPKFLKEFFNIFKNEKGIVHILPLILILGGIVTGVFLVQKEGFQIFNPKAASESIQLEDGSCVKVKDGKKVLTCGNFSFKLYSPIESNPSSDAELNMSIIKPAHAAEYGTGDENGIGIRCGVPEGRSPNILNREGVKISECESGYLCTSRKVNLLEQTISWCARNGVPLVKGSEWRCQHTNDDIGFGRKAGKEAIHRDGLGVLFANFGEQNIDCPENYICSKDESRQRTTCVPKQEPQGQVGEDKKPSCESLTIFNTETDGKHTSIKSGAKSGETVNVPQGRLHIVANHRDVTNLGTINWSWDNRNIPTQTKDKINIGLANQTGDISLNSQLNNVHNIKIFIDNTPQPKCEVNIKIVDNLTSAPESKPDGGDCMYSEGQGNTIKCYMGSWKNKTCEYNSKKGVIEYNCSTGQAITPNPHPPITPPVPLHITNPGGGTSTGNTAPTSGTSTPNVGSQTSDNLKITLCGTEMTLGEAKSVVKSQGYGGLMDVVSVGNEYLKTMCPGSQNNCTLEPNFPEILEATPKVGSTEYIWVANCNRACLRNNSTGNDKDLLVDPNPNDPAACPKNYSDGNVNPATSNWCHGFKDGNRCMVLWSKAQYQDIKAKGGNPFDIGNSPQDATPANPAAKKTVGYRVSELPLDSVSESQIPFINYTNGVQVQHVLSNSMPGIKSIFVQFKDDQGNIVKANPYPFTIELISEPQTPQGTQATTCVINQTECSCGNTLLGDTRDPGKCSPDCNGGWCKGDSKSSKGGICASCNQ